MTTTNNNTTVFTVESVTRKDMIIGDIMMRMWRVRKFFAQPLHYLVWRVRKRFQRKPKFIYNYIIKVK